MKTLFSAFLFLLIFSCNDSNESIDESMLVNLSIGDSYQGGIIFYLDSSSQHGLIAAEMDQAADVPWACDNLVFYGVVNTEIGSGQQNTNDIISGINASSVCTPDTYAAKICSELVIDGYSDWYLPSSDELALMYDQRSLIGNFEVRFYWSSSEYNENWTGVKFFEPNTDLSDFDLSGKSNPNNVRAIRSF